MKYDRIFSKILSNPFKCIYHVRHAFHYSYLNKYLLTVRKGEFNILYTGALTNVFVQNASQGWDPLAQKKVQVMHLYFFNKSIY